MPRTPSKRSSVLICVLAGVLTLSGCASTTSATRATSSTPEPTSSTKSEHTDPGITLTCGVVSVIETTTLNAYSGYQGGHISAADYAAVINTVPQMYRALSYQPERGLRNLIDAAAEATKSTPATVPGAAFDPNGQPYSQAAESLRTACEAAGDGVKIAGQYGG